MLYLDSTARYRREIKYHCDIVTGEDDMQAMPAPLGGFNVVFLIWFALT